MGNFHNELKNFQPIPRDLIFDGTMSDRARFLFCYMAAKPDDWDFLLSPMAAELGYSVDTLRKYINELVEHGWLVKGEQANDGRFGAVCYTLKSQPQQTKPCTENSDTEKFRHGDFPTQTNKDNKQIKDSIQKRENKIEEKKNNKLFLEKKAEKQKFSSPTIDDIHAYVDEKGYHFDVEAFYDYYTSDDWHYVANGKRRKVVSWRRCCATWEARWRENNKNSNNQTKQSNNLPYGMILTGDRQKIMAESQNSLWD